MLKNYFLVALRSLKRHKIFSLINILGLSVGITCCVLITLYVKDELSYEKHFSNPESIYRITSTFNFKDGSSEILPRTSPPITMTLLDEIPEIETATRVVNPPQVEQHLVRYKDYSFYEDKGFLVDSTFFEVFDYEFKEGNPDLVLDQPSTVVISAKMASKIFGQKSALDESLIITSGGSVDTFRITGVLKQYKAPSHVDADFYMCMNSKGWGAYVNSIDSWATNNFIFGYLKLNPDVDPNQLQPKFIALMNKYGGEELAQMGRKKSIGLHPLTKIRLYSSEIDTKLGFDLAPLGDILYLKIIIAIGVLILIIACINFTNLAIAQSSKRAAEIGIRKTMGAVRSMIAGQFLAESVIIASLSIFMAGAFVNLLLPWFNSVSQKNITWTYDNIVFVGLSLLIIGLITGILSGIYPAYFLSALEPAKILKDKRLSLGKANWLRKGLIVFQFVVSIGLIASILVIQYQLKYVKSKSLGYTTDQKILIPLRTLEAQDNYTLFKQSIEQLNGVTLVTAATTMPSTPLMSDLPLYKQGQTSEDSKMHYMIQMDEGYFDMLDVPLIEGRNLDIEKDNFSFSSPTNRIIINRASIEQLQIPLHEAIGAKLKINFRGELKEFEVVGVIENYHQNSLRKAIEPIVYTVSTQSSYVYAAVKGDFIGNKNLLINIEKSWKGMAPYTPFESIMLSDSVAKQYESDTLTAQIIFAFAIVAIFISSMGLFGLTLFEVERRVKEIGIRKILGASAYQIVYLIGSNLLKLIFIALVIAVPVSYWLMDKWLAEFAYKISMNPVPFLLAGVLAFSITSLTVGYQALKASFANPVDALKND